MSKHVRTTSEEGSASTTEIRDYSVGIDPGGAEAPDTLEMLLASYAACYVPALRVGAKQRNVGDLGSLEIAASGELNEDDKLASIAFEITVDAELDPGEATAAVERAFELCKVHDGLKPDLHAAVTLNGHAV